MPTSSDQLPLNHAEKIESYNTLFLSGPFGSGKTTLAIKRIRWLLAQERVRGDDIIVLVPQPTLTQPYYQALRGPDTPSGPPVRVTTLSGFASNALELYWPLIASEARFVDSQKEPTFLNLETGQYHMAHFVDAAIGRADFDGIRIVRSRIISQILDNLNKAALHGFGIDETYQRLELAVPSGEQRTARMNALRSALRISHEFRQLCLQETLIDFSLQIELFRQQVLTNEWSRTHLFRSHRHLIADNVEEDNYTAHQLLRAWIPQLDSALVVSDTDAGYRLFLGADPKGVSDVANICTEQIRQQKNHTTSPALERLTQRIEHAILGNRAASQTLESVSIETSSAIQSPVNADKQTADASLTENLTAENPFTEDPLLEDGLPIEIPNTVSRFYPQMIEHVVNQIRTLVHNEEVPPGEIAVLAPFMSDALRFSLQSRLSEVGIDSATHRPSRALQDEPASRALLTLAALAHPDWGIRPTPPDVTLTLTLCIAELDPVRAHLLSRIVYPPRQGQIELGRFGQLIPDMQQRITYLIGERYDRLREWLYDYRASAELVPLDQFMARLFGEVLSQPGFGFHNDYDAARIANQLVQSARNFRWALEDTQAGAHQRGRQEGGRETDNLAGGKLSPTELGREYLRLIESGALGALFVPSWRTIEDAVFLSPAYTFLMRNRTVDVQFWIDIGSGGWWERLFQPLTHPHVLSRHWPPNELWTDYEEFTTRQDTMRRLLLGLVRRTRQRVYLGLSDYSESGFEQRGPLLMLINRLLTQEEGQ